MTILYTPKWEDTAEMVDGDLCDITLCTRDGRKQYCGQTAVRAALDVDGFTTRILCQSHTDLYFPNHR
jgi:hypothetical protein